VPYSMDLTPLDPRLCSVEQPGQPFQQPLGVSRTEGLAGGITSKLSRRSATLKITAGSSIWLCM
jgi:hypothetical protein